MNRRNRRTRQNHGKSKNSDLGGVLYRARRRATYNETIPESERKTQKNPFNIIAEKLRSKTMIAAAGRRGRAAIPKRRKDAHVRSDNINILSDKRIVIALIVCVILVVSSCVAVPLAFAKETITVNILDSGRTFTAHTTAKTVGELLENNNIEIGENDYLETPEDTVITDNMDIIIRRAMELTVRAGEKTKKVSMVAGTVADAINAAGITIGENDEVYPSAETYVRSGMTIDYIQVQVEYEKTTRVLGYQEIEREDDTILKGDSEVVQYGEEGEMEVTTKYVYKNGALYSEEVVAEEVTKEPVNEIIAIGTKSPPKKTATSKPSSSGGSSSGGSSGGANGYGIDPSSIKEVLSLECTAYNDSRTATGNYPGHGTIAANPSIFPYGTRLYVVGYGYGVVHDTGGFVSSKPYNLDLWMSSDAECSSWGRRTTTVYVLY